MSKPFEDKETHPSYAKIQIARVTGGKRPLFASSVMHGETIRIRITRASIARDLNTDWIFGEDELVEVEMSPIQFAELLTTHGSGVPCTLIHLGRTVVEPCGYVDKKEQFRDEFAATVSGIADHMQEMSIAIDELKTAKSIRKSDLERIGGLFQSMRAKVTSSMPFAAKCFDEQMERSTLEAKGEIEAYMLHRALKMAQEGMKLVEQLDDQNEQPIVQLDDLPRES